MSFLKYKPILKQLLGLFFTALCVFLIVYGIDRLPTNNLVNKFSDNLYALNEFLLNVLLRVAPILVPFVIATSSIMINKYSSAFFKVLFSDKWVSRLSHTYIFFFSYHCIVVLAVGKDEDAQNNFIENFSIYLIDTIIAAILFIVTIKVIFQVFSYTQPEILIKNLRLNKDASLNKIENLFNKEGFEEKDQLEERIKSFSSDLIHTLNLFTNITVIAVRSKDYQTIDHSLKEIGNNVWTSTVNVFKNINLKDLKESNDIRNNEQKEFIVSLTANQMKTLETKVAETYTEIFESAYSSKEFIACTSLLNHLFNSSDDLSFEKRLDIYNKIFRIVLSYGYSVNTNEFCTNIIDKITTIFMGKQSSTKSIKGYKIYFEIIKDCIDYGNMSMFKYSLINFRNAFREEREKKVRERGYNFILSAAAYCLQEKKMKFFAEIVRFAVTKSQGLKLNEMNELFASAVKKDEIIKSDELSFLDTEVDENYSEVFNISSENIPHLRLKFYFIFHSYYKLQERISPNRIDIENKGLTSESLKNNIPFHRMRALLIDLETHITKWDNLFVKAAKEFFVESAQELLMLNHRRLIEIELKTFKDLELFKELRNKIAAEQKSNYKIFTK